MKSIAAILFTAAFASSAAADYYHVTFRDTPPPVLQVQPWSGWYFGGNVGYGWTDSNSSVRFEAADNVGDAFATTIPGVNNADAVGGLQGGYGFQQGAWVYGLETDIQGAGFSGSGSFGATWNDGSITGTLHQSIDWFGTLRGRVGYLPYAGPALLYVTGGFAYGEVRDQLTVTDGITSARLSRGGAQPGVAVGGGFEYLVNLSWSLKAEYLYVDLTRLSDAGSFDVRGISYGGSAHEIDASFQIVRAGLNYHLNNSYQPLK